VLPVSTSSLPGRESHFSILSARQSTNALQIRNLRWYSKTPEDK